MAMAVPNLIMLFLRYAISPGMVVGDRCERTKAHAQSNLGSFIVRRIARLLSLPLFATAAYVLTQNLGIASKRILLLLGHADLFQNVGPIVYAMPSSQPIAAVLLGLNAFPLSPFFLPFSFAILILSMYRDEGFWAVPLESKLALERGR